MKSKTKYRKAPKRVAEAITRSEVVTDFLPAPDKLVFKENTVKITLSLSKTSIDFFKAKASQYDVPYQTMIKKVVDLYAQQHQK
jgi:predicted DNA binding CopG/RHH family protein